MTVFNLPDLGEGLPDAEIVKWLVAEGADIALGDPMVEMSTAKAVVEVPAPYTGKVVKLHGGEGDVIETGATLVTFALNGEDVDVEDTAVKEDAAPAPVEAAPVASAQAATTDNGAKEDGQGIEVFKLPDLGEGLPDAEIVKWLVAEGDDIGLGDDMVEMSTAKAVVEVPSPFAGVVVSLYGGPGDVIDTGNPLIAVRTGKEGASVDIAETVKVAEGDGPGDTGTVVGEITVSNEIKSEAGTSVDGVRASPAVRATARKMKIELAAVKGTGTGGEITLKDVREAVDSGAAKAAQTAQIALAKPAAATISTPVAAAPIGGEAKIGPAARNLAHDLGIDPARVAPSGPKGTITRQDVASAAKAQMISGAVAPQALQTQAPAGPVDMASGKGVKAAPKVRAYAREKGIDIAAVAASGSAGNVTLDDVNAALKGDFRALDTAPAQSMPYSRPARAYDVSGQPEKIIGPRRVMANMMAKANAEICHTPIFDEADIAAWPAGTDITVRIMRAVIAGAYAEPAINAWYNHEVPEKTNHAHVSLGVAVDSPRGLFVPVIKNIDSKSNADMRADLDRHRKAIGDGSIGPKDMSGATITLSNYGMMAGKFAAPRISAPEVAIVGVGGLYDKLVMDANGIANHRFMPVSLTFDHRACTGGEAARFLRGVLDDLESAN